MKKIVIVSYSDYSARIHKQTLNEIFRDEVIVDIISLESNMDKKVNDANVAILLTSELTNFAIKALNPDTKMILAECTLPKDKLKRIQEISSEGKQISVVYEDYNFANIRKQLLINLGIPEKSLDLWYPEMKEELLNNDIVVFGNCGIPSSLERNIIRVKGRLLSIDTIIKVMLSLGKEQLISKDQFKEYSNSICIDYYKF